jgi:predicted lipoprotein with Yx(FWY)xxD motif
MLDTRRGSMTQREISAAPARGRRLPLRRSGRIAAAALSAAAIAAVPLAQGASAAGSGPRAKVVTTGVRTGFGTILVAPSGRALYYDSADTPDHSTCTGSCALIWPPVLMPPGKTIPIGVPGLGTITRNSGKVQVTYNSMPLYKYAGDSGTSVSGNGVAGFFVIKVA